MASKSFRVAGGVLRNGVLIKDAHQNMARAGAPKKLTTPAITPGMRRTTTGALHPYLHSRPIDDETADKFSHGKQVAVHPAMRSRTSRGVDGDGFEHLQKAGRLGAPVGGWKR